MSGVALFTLGAVAGLCAGAAIAWLARPLWDVFRQPDPHDGSTGG